MLTIQYDPLFQRNEIVVPKQAFPSMTVVVKKIIKLVLFVKNPTTSWFVTGVYFARVPEKKKRKKNGSIWVPLY